MAWSMVDFFLLVNATLTLVHASPFYEAPKCIQNSRMLVNPPTRLLRKTFSGQWNPTRGNGLIQMGRWYVCHHQSGLVVSFRQKANTHYVLDTVTHLVGLFDFIHNCPLITGAIQLCPKSHLGLTAYYSLTFLQLAFSTFQQRKSNTQTDKNN